MNPRKKTSLFLTSVWIAIAGVCLCESARGEPTESPGQVTLGETLSRMVESDRLVQKYRAEWRAADANIEQILLEDGWTLELGARNELKEGDRLETRDDSRGRDPRRDYARLKERGNYFLFGLSNSFLEDARQRKADAWKERISRLDSVPSFEKDLRSAVLNAAFAFVGAHYDRRALSLAERERLLEEENVRIVQERVEQEEALRLDLLEAEAEKAEAARREAVLKIRIDRQMDLLRDIWGWPDLEPDLLASPEIPEATDYAYLDGTMLVERAFENRGDLEAGRKARESHLESSKYTKALPDVDFSVTSRVGHDDRAFADEGRHSSTYDLRLDLEVSIPLSLAKRNEARLRQFQLDAKAREYDLQAMREETALEVREAYEEYLLANEEVKVQTILLEKAREMERHIRLIAETMPETLSGDPDSERRSAEGDRLETESAWLTAHRTRIETVLLIQALVGDLVPHYRELVSGPLGVEK